MILITFCRPLHCGIGLLSGVPGNDLIPRILLHHISACPQMTLRLVCTVERVIFTAAGILELITCFNGQSIVNRIRLFRKRSALKVRRLIPLIPHSHDSITICVTTGGLSSSCEMIILGNKSHGEIIRVCMEILTTALRNINSIKFSIKIPHLTSTVRRLLSDRLLF